MVDFPPHEFERFAILRLVLASSSPRRSLILVAAGFDPEIRSKGVDETFFDNEPVQEAVLRVAGLKAAAVQRDHGEVVLAADTIVTLDDEALGKPLDAEHAAAMLTALAGRTHSVFTGWTAIGDMGERFGIAETRVTFRDLSPRDISDYITDAQPFDKAGSYGIQGENGRLIEQVTGSRANVMGLPLREIVDALSDLGIERSPSHRRSHQLE